MRDLTPYILPLLLLFLSLSRGTEDWTLQCPTGCRCTWVSGKKTGDCRFSPTFSNLPTGLSPEVQVLQLSGNPVTFLEASAFRSVGLINLQKVFLSSCQIKRVHPEAFLDLEIMIELDLSNNLISTLDLSTFTSNIRLRELKLSGNPLATFSSRFPPLKYLKLLLINDCLLSTLSEDTFINLPQLETLSLQGNRLRTLSSQVFEPIIKIKSISLSGNPWRCDCHLKGLRDYLERKDLLRFQTNLKCQDPPELSSLGWEDVREFPCPPEIPRLLVNNREILRDGAVNTEAGSEILLQCLIRGSPFPEGKWVRDGQVLSNESRPFYLLTTGVEGGNEGFGRWANLTILRTDLKDAGDFTCVGSNSGGLTERNLTLNFQEVPVGHGLGGVETGDSGDSRGSGLFFWAGVGLLLCSFLGVSILLFCSRRAQRRRTGTKNRESGERKENGTKEVTVKLNGCPKNGSSGSSSSSPGRGESGVKVELTYPYVDLVAIPPPEEFSAQPPHPCCPCHDRGTCTTSPARFESDNLLVRMTLSEGGNQIVPVHHSGNYAVIHRVPPPPPTRRENPYEKM